MPSRRVLATLWGLLDRLCCKPLLPLRLLDPERRDRDLDCVLCIAGAHRPEVAAFLRYLDDAPSRQVPAPPSPSLFRRWQLGEQVRPLASDELAHLVVDDADRVEPLD